VDNTILWKAVENLASTGLILWVIWKLLDKWAGPFLDAALKQASAMGALATAVKEGQGDSRETLLAIRVLATEVREMKRSVDQWNDTRRPDGAGH